MLKYEVGTICDWVVGMPGPDIDQMMIVDSFENGYSIIFQVYGRGEFHKDDISEDDRFWIAKREMSPMTQNLVEKRSALGLPKPQNSL